MPTHFISVAVLNTKDSSHFDAVETRQLLGGVIVVITETVLIEVLNYFAEYGTFTRKSAADAVRTIIKINREIADQAIIYRKNKSEKIKLPDAGDSRFRQIRQRRFVER